MTLISGEGATGFAGTLSLLVFQLPFVPTLVQFSRSLSRIVPASRNRFSRRPGKRRGERVLMLGDGPLYRAILEELAARPGFHPRSLRVSGEKVAGGSSPVRGAFLEFEPDRIVVSLGEQRGKLLLPELLGPWAHGIVIEDGVEFYERLTGKLAIEAITPSRFVFCREFQRHPVDAAARRALSLAVAIAGLALTAPLLVLIAALIKLDSPGPVLFVQGRIGAGERPFPLFKFRTMRAASVRRSEWVRDNGDRITRLGAWLRKFRLDELPQFVNVLRGEMDVVGPRPHPVSNHELLVLVARNAPECGHKIPYYTLRSLVRPGITGWAQVRYGYANDVDEELEKLRYDLYYVKHRSLWLDLSVLFETVGVILFGRGSDRVVAGAEPHAAGGERVSP